MNLFVAWKMNTNYLHLYILGGYEHFYCVKDDLRSSTYYLCLDILGFEHFGCVEDEYTYYLRLYILGYEHVVWKMNTHIIYVYIL